MTQNINETLKQRGSRYGEYKDVAATIQALKNAMRKSPNWDKLSDDKKETLDMIQHKIGRILNGDPEYPDNFHDISGYAKLSEDLCKTDDDKDLCVICDKQIPMENGKLIFHNFCSSLCREKHTR